MPFGLGPVGFRPPAVLPLYPEPDLEPKFDFERAPEEGLPGPLGLDFQAGFPAADGPPCLLLGRAPPARGLP
ncbi:MAG: hypothetical protein WBX19_17440, partial [Terracidiphilus sp.]